MTSSILLCPSLYGGGDKRLFSKKVIYYVELADVEALPIGGAVKVAGVRMGSVQEIEFKNQKAFVTIRVDPTVLLYQNASAHIGSAGVVGTRFLVLNPGTTAYASLPKGAILPESIDGRRAPIIKEISSLFENEGKYGNAVENIKIILANSRRVTAAMDAAVGDDPQKAKEIVENIDEIKKSWKIITANWKEISDESKDDLKVALAEFKEAQKRWENISQKIEGGSSPLAAFVADSDSQHEFKDTVKEVQEAFSTLRKKDYKYTDLHTYWNYLFRYDFRDDKGKSDLAFSVWPKPGKYYKLGVTNIGEAVSKHKIFERRNRVTALMGKEWGPVDGSVGFIRSHLGGGVNFRPLWWSKNLNRRLEINIEATDFNRDRVVNGQRIKDAWLMAGTKVSLTEWGWVGARWEDILERSAFMVTVNIDLQDQTILGLLDRLIFWA